MITKRLLTVVTCLIVSLMPVAGLAQDADSSTRETQISSIVDALNSPDPAKRLATFEEAVGSSDSTLRRVALSTAFASSDSDLRSIALNTAMTSMGSFVVEITDSSPSSCTPTWQQTCPDAFKNGLGPSFEVRMSHVDQSTGRFKAWASFSGNRETAASQSRYHGYADPRQFEIITSPGSVSGGRLSFEVDASGLKDLAEMYFSAVASCSGVVRLNGGSATLKGSMTCSSTHSGMSDSNTENFTIEVNVLE